MKIVYIIIIFVFLTSIGFSQLKPVAKDSHENKNRTGQQKSDDKKIEEVIIKQTLKEKPENTIDLKISNQNVTVSKIENENSNKKEKNKEFGSTEKSGPEEKLIKSKNQSAISNDELKKKLNNPKKLKQTQ